MKRSAALAPLSRDHHHVLDVALRMRRVEPGSVADVVATFVALWQSDMQRHFAIEEQVLVPALAGDAAWEAGCARMVGEHEEIRRRADALAAEPGADPCRALGELLNAHVRFEERELFGLLEEGLDPAALAAVGARVEELEAR